MHRRFFLQSLAALFASGKGQAVVAKASPDVVRLPHQPVFSPHLSELERWQRLPMLPLTRPADFAMMDEPFRQFAILVLGKIRNHPSAIGFHYHGGSTPGEWRRVLPFLLFQKINDFDPPAATRPDPTQPDPTQPVYLQAWCTFRHAPRTFRMDRIVPDDPGNDIVSHSIHSS